ncbi:YSIRK-type signal peptide-containing protein [Gemella sp. zg-570]|uniref:YSIRK-type signal peptide-containing protein n=1 Tax=Gemella sp. zg-570 TaxID=2840371 RepID=UPI001C0C5A84|nr:YSIRK-type signal peptide-containing protein [Gemella sp. zg-570]QWQ39032.1 YSIRK-type signal peptide-containing protein [Gemella sp. zg-570]
MDKKKKYAIRKLTVGAVSIAVGLSLVASNIKTEAQEPKGLETKYNKEDGYIGETKDESILGVLYKKEGRIFLKAKALQDVENVSVEIYDQKGNKYLSKIAKLKAEEEEEIEVKKEGKRVLPNTALVRKTLAFEAQTGEDSYKVRISYDVEEDIQAASPEVPASQGQPEASPAAPEAETAPSQGQPEAEGTPESGTVVRTQPGTEASPESAAPAAPAESQPMGGAATSPAAPAGTGAMPGAEPAPADNTGTESQPDTGAEASPETGAEPAGTGGEMPATSPESPAENTGAETGPAGRGEVAPARPEASPAAPAGNPGVMGENTAEANPGNHEMPETGGAIAGAAPEAGTAASPEVPEENTGTESQPMGENTEVAGTGGDMAAASPTAPAENNGAMAGAENTAESNPGTGGDMAAASPTAPAENNGAMAGAESQPMGETGAAGSGETGPAAPAENNGEMPESGTVVRTQPGNEEGMAEASPETGAEPAGTGGDMATASPGTGTESQPMADAGAAASPETGAEPAGTGASPGTGGDMAAASPGTGAETAPAESQPGNHEMPAASPGAEERPEAGASPTAPEPSPENGGDMAAASPAAPAENNGEMPESGTVVRTQPGNEEGMAEASPENGGDMAEASPVAPEASPAAPETDDMEEEAPEPEPTEKLYVNTSASEEGDGSKEKPYNDLMDAIEAANDGEAVVLLGDVNLSTYMNNSTLTTSKSITIDGQGHTIYGRDLSYSFKGDKTVLKNITLSSTQDGYTPQYIYTNHSSVTFDNVTTRPMGTQNQDAFILVVGSDSSDVATEKDVTVIFKNSPAPTEHTQGRDGKSYTGTAFKKIITANMNNSTSRKIKLKLDAHTRIDTSSSNPMGISLSSGNHMNTGEVSITLEGNSDINYIDASNASNSSLILKNRNGNKKLDIKNKINNITLNNSSVTFSNNVKDIDTLEMKNANDSVQVAPSTNMNIGNIKSNGGKIKLGLNSSINVKNNISGNLNLSINPQKFEITDESNERIYLTVGSGNLDEVNASIEFNEKSGDASNYELKKEDKKLKLVRKNQANIAMEDEPLVAPTASFTEPEEEDGILNVFFDINGEGITSRKLIIKKASDDSTFKNITLGNSDFSYILRDLTSGEKYKLKLEIEYDLKDGRGTQTLEEEYSEEVSV